MSNCAAARRRIAWAFGWMLLASVFEAAAQSPPQPPAAAAPPEDGNWVMPGKNAASTRFSGLDQINDTNVAQLKVEFTFSTGAAWA